MKKYIKQTINFIIFLNNSVEIAKSSIISLFAKFRILEKVKIIIGENITIYENCLIDAAKSILKIANNTKLHKLVTIV